MEKCIPKTIHYCWFGKGEKPKLVKKCIDSWKNNLYGYEIIEWNEDNFEISCNKFVKEAYENKKYAFVSDYVRAYVLFNYGGIYLDTDVEVFKNFDDLLDNESFWGFEEKDFIATSTIGCTKGNKFMGEFLNSYSDKSFIKEDGTIDTLTNVAIITRMVKDYGLILDGSFQAISGMGKFYPQEFFSPYDYINCYMKKTHNTYCVHYYYKSWLTLSTRVKSFVKKCLACIIGGENIKKFREKVTS